MKVRILGICCAVALAFAPALAGAAIERCDSVATYNADLVTLLSNDAAVDTLLITDNFANAADNDLNINYDGTAAFTDTDDATQQTLLINRGRTAPVTISNVVADGADGTIEIFGGAYNITIQGLRFTNTAAPDADDASLFIGVASETVNITVRNCDQTGGVLASDNFIVAGALSMNTSIVNCSNDNAGAADDDDTNDGAFVMLGNGGGCTNCSANGVSDASFIATGSNMFFRNCEAEDNIFAFGTGNFQVAGGNNNFQNCVADGNTGLDCWLISGSHNTFTNCRAHDSDLDGFDAAAGFSNTFTNCKSGSINAVTAGNDDDGFLDGGNDTYTNCLSQDNGDDGFNVSFTNNSFKNCRAVDNTDDGFDVDSATNNFTSCSATDNGGDGFEVDADDNLFTTCRGLTNTGDEFSIDTTGNFLDRCSVGTTGVLDDEGSADSGNMPTEILAGDNAGRRCTGGTVPDHYNLR